MPPKGEGWRIFMKTSQLILAAVAVFYAVHLFANPMPRTMSKEWQEASNEYAQVCLFSSREFVSTIPLAPGFRTWSGMITTDCPSANA